MSTYPPWWPEPKPAACYWLMALYTTTDTVTNSSVNTLRTVATQNISLMTQNNNMLHASSKESTKHILVRSHTMSSVQDNARRVIRSNFSIKHDQDTRKQQREPSSTGGWDENPKLSLAQRRNRWTSQKNSLEAREIWRFEEKHSQARRRNTRSRVKIVQNVGSKKEKPLSKQVTLLFEHKRNETMFRSKTEPSFTITRKHTSELLSEIKAESSAKCFSATTAMDKVSWKCCPADTQSMIIASRSGGTALCVRLCSVRSVGESSMYVLCLSSVSINMAVGIYRMTTSLSGALIENRWKRRPRPTRGHGNWVVRNFELVLEIV
jgi:hypothetical protein